MVESKKYEIVEGVTPPEYAVKQKVYTVVEYITDGELGYKRSATAWSGIGDTLWTEEAFAKAAKWAYENGIIEYGQIADPVTGETLASRVHKIARAGGWKDLDDDFDADLAKANPSLYGVQV